MGRTGRGARSGATAAALAAAVAIAAAGASGAPGSTRPIAIMPLGDSITDGHDIPGGYRVDLEDDLRRAGLAPNFVGSLRNGPVGLADKDHEGHSGWRIDEVHAAVSGWLRTHRPTLVLLLIGTNDVAQGYRLSTARRRLGSLLDRIHAVRPATRILVSTIPPLADPIDNAQAAAYNAGIPALVRTRVAKGRPITFVDAGRRLTLRQLADGVHPDASGYRSLSDSWFAAIRTVVRGKRNALSP